MPLYLKDKMVSGISLGVPGKSAYEQAKEGGYTGTEEEFAEILANAATKDYVDEAIGEIPTPDVSGQIEEHNQDENAHAELMATKAPAGYGLGTQTGREISNCDEATLNGWYKVVDGTNIPSGANSHGWMEVSSRDIGDDRRQDYYTSDSEPKHYYRYAVDSVWGAWRCADITYGTTDLTAGSSPLATGQLHFVYE